MLGGFALSGCGGGGTVPAPSPSAPSPTPSPTAFPSPSPLPTPFGIVVGPDTALVSPLGTQNFTATVAGTSNQAVVWSIVEGAEGGSVTSDGVYTAPVTVGTYHLVARSIADPAKTGVVVVTVANQVVVSPSAATLTLGEVVYITASFPDAVDQSVIWSVLEDRKDGSYNAGETRYTSGDVIGSPGSYIYIAPRIAGVFHLVATSYKDRTKISVIVVTVQSGSASGAIQ